MDYKEKAKELRDLVKQSERERLTREREEKRLSERTEQERKQVVKMLGPRVREVCGVFAHGIKGKLRSSEDPPSKFALLGPKGEYGGRSTIDVHIDGSGVLVSTRIYTAVFFEQLFPVKYSEPCPSLNFFRRSEFTGHDSSYNHQWAACYYIPAEKFSEDKLGYALEVLCKEIIADKSTIFKVDIEDWDLFNPHF